MLAREQLLRLLRIQELAHEIRAARGIVDRAPGRLEEIEARFRERNAEYVAVHDRLTEVESDRSVRSGDLQLLEERRKKYMDDLMQVKNQREYAAMLKEIDAVKSLIGDHEETILRDYEEIEQLRTEMQSQEEHIAEERKLVASERGSVESEAETASAKVVSLEAERAELEAGLPPKLLVTVRVLETTRAGLFLSRVDNGTCQACYVRVRPQVYQEIRQASVVHTCSNCRRFLYVESSLRVGPGPATASGPVEALEGGAA